MTAAWKVVRCAPVGEDEDADHDAEEEGVLPEWAGGLGLGLSDLGVGLILLFFAEEEVHDQADHDAEADRTYGACDAELESEDVGGQDDGQDIDGGTGIEECASGSEPSAHAPDSGEQGEHRA